MALADRVKDSTTTSGTGAITLAQSVQTGFQLFGTAFSSATPVTYCISSRTTADWEVGNGTFTPPATLTRSPTASSNANGLVNFGAEIKDVFVTQSASNVGKLLSSDDIAFSASVPFTGQGVRYMPQQSVGGVIAFTPNATGALKNAQVYVRLLADATNTPTFVGFKEWGGSLGYDNRNQIANQITFWYDGYDYWYSVSQAVGAVAQPTATTGFTMTGPTSGVASTASTNFTVGVTPVGSALTGTVRVTPNDASGGGTFTPTFLDLTGTSATGTFTYTPNSTVTTRTISLTNNGSGLTNGSSISYSVTAAATVPGAPTIGTATAGDASASVAFTAPASNGGSAITGYTVTSSPGGFTGTGATSPISVTGLTNGTAYTFTAKATNGVGQSAASAASNSATPAATTSVLRFGQLSNVTESGTSPNYVYSATSGAGTVGYTGEGILNVKFQSGVDGSMAMRFPFALVNAFIWGLTTSSTPVSFGSIAYGIYVNSSGIYSAVTAGTPGVANVNASLPFAANDQMRIQRIGSTINAQCSKDSGSNWTTFQTWTGASTALLYVDLALNNACTVDQLTGTGLS